MIKIVRSKELSKNREGSMEEYIRDLATVISNIMIIGKEKAARCIFFDRVTGTCTLLKFDVDIPTLHTIQINNEWRPRIDKHPEVCAVCPFWRSREG
jgi:hypothetical protein